MIIGNGLLANIFKSSQLNNDDNVIVFASGVSSSKENQEEQFLREKNLLITTIKNHPNSKLIYFSSILSEINTNPYYTHKLNMERFIQENCLSYVVYKLPQIVGFSGNKENLLNHLITKIQNNEKITIYNEVKRSLVDIEDVAKIVINTYDMVNNKILYFSHIEKLFVKEICEIISFELKKELSLEFKDVEDDSNNWNYLNSKEIQDVLTNLNIQQDEYTHNLIKKYLINGNFNRVL